MNTQTDEQVEWKEANGRLGTEHVATLAHGVTVRVMHDDDTEAGNPREWDQLGHMQVEYRGYTLGDEQGQPNREFDCSVCGGEGLTNDERDCPACEGTGIQTLPWYDAIKREHGSKVVLPLFLLDHSGLAMTCGSNLGSIAARDRFVGDGEGWDTSMVGFIFDTNETREKLGLADASDEEIERQLRGEVSEYDDYLHGYVYGYVVEHEGETKDSCWGFLDGNIGEWNGEPSHTKQEALAAARSVVEDVETEIERAHYWAARDVVTV